jgi:hypothetical protein
MRPSAFSGVQMFVKLTTGVRAGQVHEMKFADARILLDSGRAERIDAVKTAAANPIDAAKPMAPRSDHETNCNARNDKDSVPRRKGRGKGR